MGGGVSWDMRGNMRIELSGIGCVGGEGGGGGGGGGEGGGRGGG